MHSSLNHTFSNLHDEVHFCNLRTFWTDAVDLTGNSLPVTVTIAGFVNIVRVLRFEQAHVIFFYDSLLSTELVSQNVCINFLTYKGYVHFRMSVAKYFCGS